ncbi:hypothetical protein FACS1894172_06310 [Spirochaetia bacterium]|nr:hypothetical protein FACS1894164_20540 [Spirochaetia bacterium]GHU31430.1 hypothetical protein FACS1894172_06310 [Spirochaetia bacterium]
MSDYIPSREAEFLKWVQNISSLCTANKVLWNFPDAELTEFSNTVAEFAAIYATAIGPTASKADILEKNKKKAVLKERVRKFKRRFIDPSIVITDPDRERLKLPITDKKPTPVPPPSTVPDMKFSLPGPRRVDLHFKDFGSDRRAKPKGAIGAVIKYAILPTAPVNQSQLGNSLFTGKSPYHFEFLEEDRSKTVYFAICWQNGKGDQGPWSEIQKAIIP